MANHKEPMTQSQRMMSEMEDVRKRIAILRPLVALMGLVCLFSVGYGVNLIEHGENYPRAILALLAGAELFVLSIVTIRKYRSDKRKLLRLQGDYTYTFPFGTAG